MNVGKKEGEDVGWYLNAKDDAAWTSSHERKTAALSRRMTTRTNTAASRRAWFSRADGVVRRVQLSQKPRARALLLPPTTGESNSFFRSPAPSCFSQLKFVRQPTFDSGLKHRREAGRAAPLPWPRRHVPAHDRATSAEPNQTRERPSRLREFSK